MRVFLSGRWGLGGGRVEMREGDDVGRNEEKNHNSQWGFFS